VGKCRLCGEDRELRKSHILPEFVYEPVYEERVHKYFQISTALGYHPRRRPTGLCEPLLCQACEDLIGVTETYAREVIYGGTEIGVPNEPSGLRIVDVDYAKFKPFQLSVLWRSGVSTLEEFRHIDLGMHEPRLREMLLAGNPGDPDEFPCFMFFSPTLHQ